MHLVGISTELYYDARIHEYQMCMSCPPVLLIASLTSETTESGLT
jgi:hypothetical protein